MRARVAWVLAAITVACGIADVIVTAQYRTLFSQETVAQHGFPFLTGAVVLSGLLGATIVARYPRHPVGWVVCLVGVTGGISEVCEAYNIWVYQSAGPGPADLAGISGWIAAMLGGQLAIGGITMILLLAPDGRLLSRRWRLVPVAVALGELMYAVGATSGDLTRFDFEGRQQEQASALLGIGFLTILVALTAGLVSMLLRLRRSSGVQRQQVRLIAVAAALVLAGLINMLVVQAVNGGHQTWAASVPMFATFLLLPVFHTVAVLRYRLHDVEVIVNRALVLAVGTAFAAGGYTTLVVLVGGELADKTGGAWLSLLATVVVALAFQPLRRWVVRLANRLAYGARARPYVALSEFSSRLAETPAPETLLPAVADAAARAISARGATVTLTAPGAGVLSATVGERDGGSTTPFDVPVHSAGLVLGNITVHVPKGRALRPSDARLLEALADQASVAFRNTATEAQLVEHVAGLDRTTKQLSESRSRIIDADEQARRTLDAAISRDVIPSLEALPDRLSRARSAVAGGSADNGLDELVRSMNGALGSLRQLTRGVFPTQLARNGLEPTLRSLLSQSGLGAALVLDPASVGRRYPVRIESTVYFCSAEAARGMSERSLIELTTVADRLQLRISGVTHGTIDLQAVRDRVDAVDGSLTFPESQLLLSIPVGVVGRVDAFARGVPDL